MPAHTLDNKVKLLPLPSIRTKPRVALVTMSGVAGHHRQLPGEEGCDWGRISQQRAQVDHTVRRAGTPARQPWREKSPWAWLAHGSQGEG